MMACNLQVWIVPIGPGVPVRSAHGRNVTRNAVKGTRVQVIQVIQVVGK